MNAITQADFDLVDDKSNAQALTMTVPLIAK